MDTRNIPEEIKARLTIEEVVGGYLPLKKAGRIFKGLCPFHSEKTPSFTVSPERGIFKCFGCGEGGDMFDFVMKLEGLSFPETVKLLGDKAGVAVPEWQPGDKDTSKPSGPGRSRLQALNEYMAKMWHKLLQTNDIAQPARDYLQRRGLQPETIATFQIGYAPFGQWTGNALRKGAFSVPEQKAAGEPARMQDRIIFPIADVTGRVVGFTGRLLESKDDPRATNRGPKYWNTPETPLFSKSRTVYALHLAKHAIREQDLAILAEGQMDVIMLHQAGYTHTVASSGTALTAEQLKLISRFSSTIAFAYDQDKAGIEATKRGIELALENELVPWVIVVPNGKDPADCLLHQPDLWEQAYENRYLYMDWVVQELTGEEKRPISPERKKSLAKELLRWVAKTPDLNEQADWLRKISAQLEVSEANLREVYRRLHPTASTPTSRAEETQTTHSQTNTTDLGETVLAILTTFPEAFPAIQNQIDTLTIQQANPLVSKAASLLRALPQGTGVDDYFTTHLTDDERKELALMSEDRLRQYEDADLSPAWAAQEMTLILQRIRSQNREQEKVRIANAIRAAQDAGKTERVQELFAELQKLM